MRVISGIYKGRELKGFTLQHTRPTMDRVKESMFAMIQNDIKHKICLDLFAGSGALGIEALSLNAKECYFVDQNKEAYQVILDNLKRLNRKERHCVFCMNATQALHLFQKKQILFDIVFLDPPYHEGYMENILNELKEKQLLHEQSLIVCEFEEDFTYDGYICYKEKTYGKKGIRILKTA